MVCLRSRIRSVRVPGINAGDCFTPTLVDNQSVVHRDDAFFPSCATIYGRRDVLHRPASAKPDHSSGADHPGTQLGSRHGRDVTGGEQTLIHSEPGVVWQGSELPVDPARVLGLREDPFAHVEACGRLQARRVQTLGSLQQQVMSPRLRGLSFVCMSQPWEKAWPTGSTP